MTSPDTAPGEDDELVGPCKNCGHYEHDDYTDECHAYCCPCIDYEPATAKADSLGAGAVSPEIFDQVGVVCTRCGWWKRVIADASAPRPTWSRPWECEECRRHHGNSGRLIDVTIHLEPVSS